MGTKQSTASSEVVLTRANSDVVTTAGRQPLANHPPLHSTATGTTGRISGNTRPLPSLPMEDYHHHGRTDFFTYSPSNQDRRISTSPLTTNTEPMSHRAHSLHHHHRNTERNTERNTTTRTNGGSPHSVQRSSSTIQSRPLPPLPPSSLDDRQRNQRRHHRVRESRRTERQEWEAFLEELGFPPPSSRPLPPPPPPLTFTRQEFGRTRPYSNEGLPGMGGASNFNSHAPITDDPIQLLRELTRRKCPVCSQAVPPNEYERHLSQCMSSEPSIQYNVDTLQTEAGECTICLEDMTPGDEIARLPCLCVYHIKCIEEWFKVKDVCPQHPDLELPLS